MTLNNGPMHDYVNGTHEDTRITKLRVALERAEEVLGNNLVWITDQADLGVRQKDVETLRRLAELEDGWKQIVMTLREVSAK